jgi:hypothetical protein
VAGISPIDCIAELAEALERGEVPPPAVRMQIAAALRRVQAEGADELTLDAALNLSPGLWRRERRRRRDALICAAYDRHLGGASLREAGRRIKHIAGELQAGRMRSASDGLAGLLREALATGVPFPGTGRRIEDVLREGCAK